jgi:hypothetical protein
MTPFGHQVESARGARGLQVVNASLLRPPPFEDPHSIVVLDQTHARPGAEPCRAEVARR